MPSFPAWQWDEMKPVGADYTDHGLVFALVDGAPHRPKVVTAWFHALIASAPVPEGARLTL